MEYANTYAIEFLNKKLNTPGLENTLRTHHKPTATIYLSSISHLDPPIPRSDRVKVKDSGLKKIIKSLINPLQKDGMEAEELKVLIRKASGFFVAEDSYGRRALDQNIS